MSDEYEKFAQNEAEKEFYSKYGYVAGDSVMHTAEVTVINDDGTEEPYTDTSAGKVILLPFDEEAEQFGVDLDGERVIENVVVVWQRDGSLLVTSAENLTPNPVAMNVELALAEIHRKWRNARDEYIRAKDKFLESAETNPEYAIKWSEDVVKATVAYRKADGLRKIVDHMNCHPEKWNREELEKLLAEWTEREVTRPLMENHYQHRSTSIFSNAVEEATREATSQLHRWVVQEFRHMMDFAFKATFDPKQ